MKKQATLISIFLLILFLQNCTPLSRPKTPTPLPTLTFTLEPTLTRTPTHTNTPTPTLSHTPTLTPTQEPYNLDFEYDGGWKLIQDQSKWPYFFGEYSTNWASQGKQSFLLHFDPPTDPPCSVRAGEYNRIELSQVVDLSGVRYIAVDLKSIEPWTWQRNVRGRPMLALELYIDNALTANIDFIPGELLNHYIPINDYPGMHTMKFRFLPYSGWCIEVGVYIDNIQLLSSIPPMENSAKSFPNVPEEYILYIEDFERGNASGWKTKFKDMFMGLNSWIVQQDAYGNHYWSGTGTRNYPQAWYLDTNWTDYAFEVRFRNDSETDESDIFICARSTDENGFYTAHFNTKWYEVAVWDGSEYKALTEVNKKDFVRHKWYLVRLELQGNEIQLFVDNELLTTVRDDTMSAGSIGFYMGGGQFFQFDDIRVWSLKTE